GGPAIERAAPDTADARLFERLRARRAALAREQAVPPYMVFGDAALWSMVALKPATREAMAEVHGVGAEKLKRYARDFLDAIDEWRSEEGA
ncbi:HRDC domain-containing protein, partial [Oharaeibacter diazotrophicus]